MSILELLGWKGHQQEGAAGSADKDAVRRIVDALDRLEPARARFVAAFAYLLSRVANADSEISPEETREMERLVHQRGGLPEEQAIIAVQIAKTQNSLFGGTENFRVGQEFAQMSSREQRLALLDCLFAVSAAEAGISVVEDNEIRRISQELDLDHKDFITVRTRYRDALNVLRHPED